MDWTEVQQKALIALQKVYRGEHHPFSKLKQLQQARIIKLVHVETSTDSSGNVARVIAHIDSEISTAHAERRRCKKDAKKEAAQKVLDLVHIYLLRKPPTALFKPVVTCRRIIGPSALEYKVMTEDRRHLQLLQSLVTEHTYKLKRLVSIDLEQYESDHSVPLEVGISHCVLTTGNGFQKIHSRHWIVADYDHLENGRFCANEKQNFLFGISEKATHAQLRNIISMVIDTLMLDIDQVYLIGHTIQNDIRWLTALGVVLPESVILCDIARAYRAWLSPTTYLNAIGMEKMMSNLGIPSTNHHNAGNDARYNIETLQRLLNRSLVQ